MKEKRFAAILLAAAMIISLCACNKPASKSNESDSSVPVSDGIVSGTESSSTSAAMPDDAVGNAILEYTYNPKLLEEKAALFLGDLLPIYESCVDAIVAHEPSVSGFASYDDFQKVWHVLSISFYPYAALIDSETPHDLEGDTVSFHYKHSDKASHDDAYNAFADVINEGLALLHSNDSDWIRIARLFRYAHTSMEYGFGNMTLYDCVVGHMGICGDYAQYFELLARNAGFNAMICGEVGLPDMEHAWTLVEIDGTWYHFDSCWGSSREFGMSTETRLSSLWSASPPDMSREQFDTMVYLYGDSWFDESEAFPDCPEDLPESIMENVIEIIEPANENG